MPRVSSSTRASLIARYQFELENSRAWISPRPARVSVCSLDVRAGDQICLGIGGVGVHLVGDAVVGVERRVVVVGELGQSRGALVVPDLGVEVPQVRLRLALKNFQAERQTRAPNCRGIGHGGAGKALRLEVDEL